jgi:dihydrodipicolinate synthase/N-acetylneuraminate lyase
MNSDLMLAELDHQLTSSEFYDNRYPFYRRLREQDPVHWSETLGGWMLTRYDNISQRDPSLARDFKRVIGDACAVFAGHDACAFEALCAGVDGWISGIPIVFPRLAVRIFDLIQSGHLAEARSLWLALTPFIRAESGPYAPEMTGTHTIAVIKASLQLLGEPVGDPIPPLQPVRGAALDYLRDVVSRVAELEKMIYT